MRRSSTSDNGNVKVTAKEREKLLDVLRPNIKNIVKDGLEQYIGAGTKFMLELLMHAEARELCGDWHSRTDKRELVRWGTQKGKAFVDGAKRPIERPRIRVSRNFGDGEVKLETYELMKRTELLDGPLVAAILCGVSARNYVRIVARGLEAKGIKKSTISRKAIAATKETVEQFRRRRLEKLDLVVLIFDGIHVGKRQSIACIGIDINGKKHVIGLRTGATENEVVCRDLLRELIERGLNINSEYLFAVDGSLALIKAIRAAFGQHVAIQRCQEHKIRDIQGYLPVKLRREFRDKLQAAYNEKTEAKALRRLDRIRLQLSLVSENAVNSLTEGMVETLTVHRLGITGCLRQSLRTTNIIESAFSSVRRYLGRVSSFKNEAQIDVWLVRSLLEAERNFRTLKGNRQLRKLRQELDLRKDESQSGGDDHA